MDKEFVPYEEAVALKELGFNQYSCLGNYADDEKHTLFTNGNRPGEINAPTFSQAFRFFREKYELVGIVNFGTNDFTFNIYNSDAFGLLTKESLAFNGTYEEAELACLKKLIEIVKEK